MRQNPTTSEAALWSALSGKRLGVRFVRQAVIGRFIVDFLAPRQKLVVEVDGGYHAEGVRADARRDETLRRWGYRVLHVDSEGCTRRLDEVLRCVVASIAP
jgi:very-short-patch-repair endonuclease